MAEIKGIISAGSNISASVDTGAVNVNSNIDDTTTDLNGQIGDNGDLSQNINVVSNLKLNKMTPNNKLKGTFNDNIHSGWGHVHIKYSHNYPTSNSDLISEPDELTYYIGVYSGMDVSPPSDFNAYKWAQFRGNDGEQGIQGEPGPKGDSGDTKLIVINPLHFKDILFSENWELDDSKDRAFYSQVVEITNRALISSTMTQEQLIEYMNIKMTDKVTPLIDVVLNNTVEIALKELEQWKYISKAYITREDILEDEVEKQKYYLHFECYRQAPNIQLTYQVKVI